MTRTCPECEGKKKIWADDPMVPYGRMTKDCPTCDGKGTQEVRLVELEPCKDIAADEENDILCLHGCYDACNAQGYFRRPLTDEEVYMAFSEWCDYFTGSHSMDDFYQAVERGEITHNGNPVELEVVK